jgi:hypothetical protein
MRGLEGQRILPRMELLFRVVLGVHIAAGSVALLVFWIPLVARKGGTTHRRAGWVYVAAAATIALSALVSCGKLAYEGRWKAGAFLAVVGLFAGESALVGVRALRAKRPTGGARVAVDLVPPVLLIACAAATAVLGLYQARALWALFAALAAAQGVAHIRFWRASPSHPSERVLAHMTGMGTSCISTLTAFVVVNAPHLGMHRFDLPLWAVPIVVLGAGLTLWRRLYAKRLAVAGGR